MRRLLHLVMAAWIAGVTLRAQSAASPEPLSAWRYFKEVRLPPSASLMEIVLDREALNHARSGQEDLRLYDHAGREVPYVLRVRRDVDTSAVFPAREFNRGSDGGVAQTMVDLGEQPQQHNEVSVDTAGNNFRRLVDVQGSPDGGQWSTLASSAIIFRFAAAGRSAEQQAVPYPVSRYRYLRVRVARDPQVDREAPELTGVRVRRSVEVKGEMMSTAAILEPHDSDRANSRPVSVWRADLGGRIPIQRIQISIGDASFSRPFELEDIDDPSAPVMLASGEIARRENASGAPLTIDFQERFARRLKLTVTDDRNPPLSLMSVVAQGAARQLVFQVAAAGAGPLRVYYGNPRALAPRYDLAARLPADARLNALRLPLGAEQENPIYRPEPKPFTERSPWLVYVVLGLSSVALAAILLDIARVSAKADQAPR